MIKIKISRGWWGDVFRTSDVDEAISFLNLIKRNGEAKEEDREPVEPPAFRQETTTVKKVAPKKRKAVEKAKLGKKKPVKRAKMTRADWTEEETIRLESLLHLPLCEIAQDRLLRERHTRSAVRTRASRFGKTEKGVPARQALGKRKSWSEVDTENFKANLNHPLETLKGMFPDKTEKQIQNKLYYELRLLDRKPAVKAEEKAEEKPAEKPKLPEAWKEFANDLALKDEQPK